MQRFWLFPFSLLLHAILKIRHTGYDWGIWPSSKGAIPTIVIGNLNLGGTGKTPFTNMLLTDLQKKHTLAFLSRGYGRRSKGFKKIEKMDDAETAGDEPLLIALHHPNIPCFVGEDRVQSIRQIQKLDEKIQWIILDDAFQHRRLKPTISIILTRWHQSFTEDQLWPVGNLRDLKSAAQKADAIVVTSTPLDTTSEEIELKRNSFQRYFSGEIFFAQTQYSPPLPLFEGDHALSGHIGTFCGIAQPDAFFTYTQAHFGTTIHLDFPDHHDYSSQDLRKLLSKMVNFDNKIQTWITTEKDAMRLRHLQEWRNLNLFYIPIETIIYSEDQVQWNQWLAKKMRK